METKEIIKRWKGNQRYTLKLIQAMPEEEFDFKAAEGTKSFRSQCSHITTWLRTHSRFVTEKEMDKLKPKSKEEIVQALNGFFDDFIAFLQGTNEDELAQKVKVFYGTLSKEFIIQTMDNHLSHHRGQMIIYLRLKGITPPSYIGW
ncbi:MAG: DinB family protein [Bacteroidota bacterium]